MNSRPTSRRRLYLDQVADSTESDEPTGDPNSATVPYKRSSPSRIVIARPHYMFDDNMDLFDTDDSIENISIENEFLPKVVNRQQNSTMRAWMEQQNINVRKFKQFTVYRRHLNYYTYGQAKNCLYQFVSLKIYLFLQFNFCFLSSSSTRYPQSLKDS